MAPRDWPHRAEAGSREDLLGGARGSRPVYKSGSGLTGACQLSQIALGAGEGGAAEGRKGHPACVRPRRALGKRRESVHAVQAWWVVHRAADRCPSRP